MPRKNVGKKSKPPLETRANRGNRGSFSRKKAPVCELDKSHYRAIFAAMTESFALRELVFNSGGKIKDYRFLEINPAFEKFIGLPRAAIIGKLRRHLPVPISPASRRIYDKVALTGTPARFESYNKSLDKYFSVYVWRPAPNQFAAIFTDITQKTIAQNQNRAAQTELKEHAAKLEKAVADLAILKLAVENASDIIFIADARGTIVSANLAANRFWIAAPKTWSANIFPFSGNPSTRNFW